MLLDLPVHLLDSFLPGTVLHLGFNTVKFSFVQSIYGIYLQLDGCEIVICYCLEIFKVIDNVLNFRQVRAQVLVNLSCYNLKQFPEVV